MKTKFLPYVKHWDAMPIGHRDAYEEVNNFVLNVEFKGRVWDKAWGYMLNGRIERSIE